MIPTKFTLEDILDFCRQQDPQDVVKTTCEKT